MNRATPQMRSFAKQLMASDALSTVPGAENPAAFHVTDKLRPHLSTFMGYGGYRALLMRALALGKAEVPWLGEVSVSANGSLEGLGDLHARVDAAEFLEGRVVLLAHLLGLLVAFIGPNLASRLVGEIWPQVTLEETEFVKEARSAKVK